MCSNLFILLIGVISLFFPLYNAVHIVELRKAHLSKTLSNPQVNYLAQLSNITHMNKVLDNICIPRVVGTTGHNNVYNYIVTQMNDMGWNVEVDTFTDRTPNFGILEFNNIVATLNPYAERYLVLACHYDSKYYKEFDFVGATDSAVPCAMLINLAYVMKKELNSNRNDVNLKLIFFDGEEAFENWGPKDSIYGARHLASKYAAHQELTRSGDQITHLDKIDLLVLLDLLGLSNPIFYSYFSDTNKWYVNFVESEKRLKKLGFLEKSKNYFQKAYINARIEDDHIPFLRKGVPIIHLIPTPFPAVWHTIEDNRQAIDMNTTEYLNMILRVFVAEYLHLVIEDYRDEETTQHVEL